VLICKDLHIRKKVLSYRNDLFNKSEIYAFINKKDGKRYIGSGSNIYRRFLDHLAGRQSNILLQRAFKKHSRPVTTPVRATGGGRKIFNL
jgi:hypothetical protein